MAKTVRVGIIGTGGISRAQAKSLGKIDDVQLVAGCDIDEDTLKDFAEKFEVPHTFKDFDVAGDAYYWFEDVSLDGKNGFHGPALSSPRADGTPSIFSLSVLCLASEMRRPANAWRRTIRW